MRFWIIWHCKLNTTILYYINIQIYRLICRLIAIHRK